MAGRFATAPFAPPSRNSTRFVDSEARFKLPFWQSLLLGLALLPLPLQAGAAWGADRLTLSYGLLERTVTIDSLKQYAADGTIPRDLRIYTRYLDETQRQQLQQVLNAQADLSAVAVAQFLYTEQGEVLLRRLGEVVRTEANLSGFYAIRSALILAAADPEGLTALNVLEKFPLSDIRIDLRRTLEILGELQTLIRETQEAVALVDQQAMLEAVASAPATATLPDLNRFGPFSWQMVSIQLQDSQRDRAFPVDLYLPQNNLPQNHQTPVFNAPVVVISHGLGSDRSSYAYLAQQLASYGFAVAMPEHPGSNAQQLQALIAGTASEITSPEEFINRPLDIQYLLDELTVLNQRNPEFAQRFNLNQVGVIGHSFGGYTALALAGAVIDFQQLAADCRSDNRLNLSLLLQCRALELPQPLPNLQDDRVKAILAINPFGSSLLGSSGFASIRIPVMLVGSSSDTITPVLLEQMRPFTWLTAPNRYFVLLEGGTHFSTIDVPGGHATEIISLPPEVVGPDPRLAQTYMKELSTAFMQTYLAGNLAYQDYLTPAYTQQISLPLLPVALIQALPLTQLAEMR